MPQFRLPRPLKVPEKEFGFVYLAGASTSLEPTADSDARRFANRSAIKKILDDQFPFLFF